MRYRHEYQKTRRQALANGDEFYYPGKKCKNGGIALRKVSDYKCICEFCAQKARDHANAYRIENPESCMRRHKRWSEKNKEYLKAKMREYYEKNMEDIKSRSSEWFSKNTLRAKESRASYYRRHKDYFNKKGRRYHWENRNKILEKQKLYYVDNRERFRAYGSKRRAALLERVAPWFGELDDLVIREAHHLARLRTEVTGFKWSVDHRVPLQGDSFSGLHCASNVQVIPSCINRSKSNNLVYVEDLDWMSYYESQ